MAVAVLEVNVTFVIQTHTAAFQELRGGRMSDGDEQPANRQRALFARNRVLEAHAVNVILPQHIHDDGVPHDLGVGLGQESLLHVLARAGVGVHWRDNQSGCKGVCDGLPGDRPSPASAPGLCQGDRCLDEALLIDLDTRLQRAASHGGTQLWVLHMLGNHGPAYFKRYPPAFSAFTPECRDEDLGRCRPEEIVNAYDNALRYTDEVLARAIERLAAHAGQVDSALIYSVVDVLLGGRRGTAAMRIEGRPYTTIERTLVERLVSVVLDDLTAAFEPLCPVHFRFERLEVNPRFAVISRPSNACVLVRLRVDMEDRGGKLEILLPYATLEPVRELLLQQFMGEKFGRDSIWETHLAEELRHTDIGLDVVLDEQMMPLSSVLNLKVGDQIALGVPPGAPVQLRCGDVPLFEGEMGRKGQQLAVKIDHEIERRKGASS